MKQTKVFKRCTLALAMSVATGFVLTGCTEKNLYDPDFGKQELPAPETLPNFSNWSAINLSVDYEMPGGKTLIEIFTDYPYQTQPDGRMTKTEALPQFAAYTDDNGRYNGQINLPATVTKVYLYTSRLGLPACLELPVKDGRIDFKDSDYTAAGAATQTRGLAQSPSGKDVPYVLDTQRGLYSLCQWEGRFGKPAGGNYITRNKEVSMEWITLLQYYLWGGPVKEWWLDNTSKLVEEKYTNIAIAKEYMEDGQLKTVESAEVKLTFLAESAWDQNAVGYYYYPSDQVPASPAEVTKYLLFPNVSVKGHEPFTGGRYSAQDAPLAYNSQITLKYINEQTGEVSDNFPPGYTIGWFLMRDVFDSDRGLLNTDGTYYYSNASWNDNGKSRCLVVKDEATSRVVVGFEDGGDNSCEDVLFFVQSNPKGAILNPDQPEIGDVEVPEETYGTYETVRTIAFEDNWPAKGDYDMNDVVVAQKQVVTFDSKNRVTKIVDTIKAVQKADAAIKRNGFAFQVDATQVGDYDTLPEGTVYEPETNSFIVFADARMVAGQEFVITRTFDMGTTFNKDELKAYNPFILPGYVAGSKSRAEVHLPKHPGTAYADPSLVGRGADAYYIDREGKYPFAIDIPTLDFVLVTENKTIGSANEYPRFNDWVENGCGEKYRDWYLNKK